MRWLIPLVFLTTLSGFNPELANVKSVYLLPMASGMDQYLANHLQSTGLYIVVTNPQAADAVFTDTLGPGFERKMTELYPPPPVEPDPKVKEKEKDRDKDKDEEVEEHVARDVETGAVRTSSFRKGRGMVFLVERKSGQVVWSTFKLPKDMSTARLDQNAKEIVAQLKKDLAAKVPK